MPASLDKHSSASKSETFVGDKHQNVHLDANTHEQVAEQRAHESNGLKGLFKDRRMLGICMTAAMGGFLFGYDQGVVGNVLVLESFGADFPEVYYNATLKGWWVSSLLLAAWFGSLVNGPICDAVGRKRNIQIMVVIFLLGSAFQTGATDLTYLFAGRVVAGLSVGALTHIVPMYLSELAPVNIRGSLVALQQLMITIGILLSYWIAYGTSHIGGTRCAPDTPYADGEAFNPYTDVPAGGCPGQSPAAWRVPVGIQLLPALILGVAMFFLPFSPRWLMSKGRDDEAQKVIAYLRRRDLEDPFVVNEFLEIKAEVTIEREVVLATAGAQNAGYLKRAFKPYKQLLTNKSNFKRVFYGSAVMFFQQFIGCNAIIYYAPTIFSQLGLDPNTTSLLATGVYGITNTLFTLPAVFYLDTFGRRPMLMAGAVGCCISLVIVGSVIAAYGGDIAAHKTAGNAAIAFVYIYDVNFSYSWAPIGWVYPSEIFNLATRSTGVSITTSSTWMCNFVIGLISPIMLENIPNGGTYFFFAAFAVLAFFFTWFFLPETRYKTLEEMDNVFGYVRTDQERHIEQTVLKDLGLSRGGDGAKHETV